MNDSERTAAKSVRPTIDDSLDIVIWTGIGGATWSPRRPNDAPSGRLRAAFNIGRSLARLGHRVTQLGEYGGVECTFENVSYVHCERALDAPQNFSSDVFVCAREPAVFDYKFDAKARVLWVHDIGVGNPSTALEAQIAKADKIFCQSHWHRNVFASAYASIDRTKIIVTRNGIDLANYQKAPHKKGNRIVYAGRPNAGLHRLLEVLPAVRREIPDTELDVFCDLTSGNTAAGTSRAPEAPANMAGLEEHLGPHVAGGYVRLHQAADARALADALSAGKVWAYPTHVYDVSGILAIEAQAAACVPVTTNLGALGETVSHGFLLKPPSTAGQYGIAFAKCIATLLRNEGLRAECAEKGRQYVLSTHGWLDVAAEWSIYLRNAVEAVDDCAGAPPPAPSQQIAAVPSQYPRMRIAMRLGRWSTELHGEFIVPELFRKRAVTGSESCFFNTVRALSERGHVVDAFCDTPAAYHAKAELAGAHVYPVAQPTPNANYDVYMSWNEPDLLRDAPKTGLRVCVQQLNDFAYCERGFDDFVDVYVMPAEAHRRYLVAGSPISRRKTAAIPNSINLDLVAEAPEGPRVPGSLIWSSSPDRGLHVALAVFLQVKKRVPEATLKIFYRFRPWYERVATAEGPIGERARSIVETFERFGWNGENGIYLLDARPNLDVLGEMKRTVAQLYTCEPVTFTEGFSVSIMDACSTGCVPIISDADALGEIYGGAAHVIPGRPSQSIERWVDDTVRILTEHEYAKSLSRRVTEFSRRFDRSVVGQQWEDFLYERRK
jgi:glycosyltransferase involved in cell wall biosynthesis